MFVRTRANAPLEPPSADGDPDASERSERGAADNQEALYCWSGPGRMGEIGRERRDHAADQADRDHEKSQQYCSDGTGLRAAVHTSPPWLGRFWPSQSPAEKELS